MAKGPYPRTAEQVLAILAERSVDIDGCLIWTHRLTNAGYAAFTWKPDGYVIGGGHRVAYWLAVGPVPAGKVLDHLCRNRACINVAHLEVVSSRENVMRSEITLARINGSKTHCVRGHEYSEENTYRYERPGTTMRICKTCDRASSKARSAA